MKLIHYKSKKLEFYVDSNKRKQGYSHFIGIYNNYYKYYKNDKIDGEVIRTINPL